MENLAEYLDLDGAPQRLRRLAEQLGVSEFAVIRNLEYVFSPFEIYPLAPRVRPPLPHISAFVMDMDGTSTTTEPLALHALEYMVRRFTGRLTRDAWPGLDEQRDYPHVIGNSNFRHTEFLVERYREHLDPAALRQAFFEAVCWTLAVMDDAQRHQAVSEHARACGLGALLEDAEFRRLLASGQVSSATVGQLVEPFVARFGDAFRCAHSGQLVAAALDIYYMRYHSILHAIAAGRGAELSRELLGATGRRLIEPMPGYEVFLSLVKGWLSAADAGLCEVLLTGRQEGATLQPEAARACLSRLAEHFRRQPARVALVTASIRYEAEVTMREVLAVAAERVRGWPLSKGRRAELAERLANPAVVFDALVNASDACEHRLKPHRDLYSLALHELSLPKADYRFCVGLEDTEPGIIALRAAGIGCAVALPNRDTARQNYRAATLIVRGGLPELILGRNLLLPEGV